MKSGDTKSANSDESKEATQDKQIRTISVFDILKDDAAIRLEMDGKIYTLQITANKKLILTK